MNGWLATPRYQVSEAWLRLPAGVAELPDIADVATDARDRVYVLTRERPAVGRVLVYEPEGTYVVAWGRGRLDERPHAITVAAGGTVSAVDELAHLIRKFTRDGDELGTIGLGKPSDTGIDSGINSLEAYPFREIWPHSHRIIEALGPERLLWASDLTGLRPLFSYAELLDFVRYTDELSENDRALILGASLRRPLNWPKAH